MVTFGWGEEYCDQKGPGVGLEVVGKLYFF